MITAHPSFSAPPNRNIRIWRYMDLAKFLSLLQTSSLYFSRADKLGDPFEGSITKVNQALRSLIRHHRKELPQFASFASMTDEAVDHMFAVEERSNRAAITELFVNCWHMNDHESAAMWRLYAKSDEAIIQSTFQRLATSLPPQVYAGLVQYRDYERDFIPAGNLFNSIMTKRMSFAHEREIRAVAWSRLSSELGGDDIRRNATAHGVPIHIDVKNLIEAIYVSPVAATWFGDVVKNILSAYSVEIEVKQSSLSETPIF